MTSTFSFLHSPTYTPISCSLNPTTTNNKTQKPQELRSQPDPVSLPGAAIKVPTAPWMMGPLVLQPHELHNLSNPSRNKNPSKAEEKSDLALTAKESGVRGNKAMKKIVESVERLRVSEELVGTRKEGSGFEMEEGLERIGEGEERKMLMPWEREQGKMVYWRVKREKVATKADLSLDKELLERLRVEARGMRKWVKVKKAGVTQDVVDEIRLAWKRSELAMVKFDVPLCRFMGRAREILEMKTGGMVVWTRKDAHVIYRGSNYKLPKMPEVNADSENICGKNGERESLPNAIQVKGEVSNQLGASLFERETDRLLDRLGPRFVDWWMGKPLPVDADMLPEVVIGFEPPSRLCPPHSRSKLRDGELTYLRKLARALPTHFVLGQNRRLQGLAAAILKLWEKSLIAKISVKWGVPNTNNAQMANELKVMVMLTLYDTGVRLSITSPDISSGYDTDIRGIRLTGGILLLRNKFFIILYRGKDFLTDQVADWIEEREAELNKCQLNEETARLKAIDNFYLAEEPAADATSVGTLCEFQKIQMRYGDLAKGNKDGDLRVEVEREKLWKELRIQEHKLLTLTNKIEKSERELSKLNPTCTPVEQDPDHEMMTEEERECLRKIGLKLRGSLVLGRRGVFDGIMEGLHQHWKHREVVKVITMQKVFAQVISTAKLLEAESGGILVSVEKLKEGHAIIIYRGKNYRRPPKVFSENLLTRRKALHRSLLLQRIGSLKFFAYQRRHANLEIKFKLAELQVSEQNNLEMEQTMG